VSALAPFGFRESAFYPAYGLAEATLLVATKRRGDAPVVRAFDAAALEAHRAVALLAAGAVPCARSRAAAPHRQPSIAIATRTRGPVRGRGGGRGLGVGPGLATGYWTTRGDRAHLRGAPRRLRRGTVLRTGDLGFVKDGSSSSPAGSRT